MMCVRREACDTRQTGALVDGEFANEEVESSCHQLICDPTNLGASSFYRNHPTHGKMKCLERDGEVVSHRRNVLSRHKTNLCRQAPVVPSVCNSQHGMLMGLTGRKAGSLYSGYVVRHRDEIVSKTGAGLFVNGGNPIYYTAKGTTDDVASEVQVGWVHTLPHAIPKNLISKKFGSCMLPDDVQKN